MSTTAERYTVGETFRSNNGAGPWTATIVHIDGELVQMQRILDGGKDVYVTRLPMWFLSSSVSGWKHIAKEVAC